MNAGDKADAKWNHQRGTDDSSSVAVDSGHRTSRKTSSNSVLSRGPSTSSTGSRKRKGNRIESPSGASSKGYKRRNTSGSSSRMAPDCFASTSDDVSEARDDEMLSALMTDDEDDDNDSIDSEVDSENEDDSISLKEDLENDAFRELEAGLNDIRYHQKDVPPQVTALRCIGIGSPKKIWSLLCRKDELIRPSSRLLEKHPDLSSRTRAILIDWLMEVSTSEKLHRETFHLAVDYIDRFLAKFEGVMSRTFQLVGTTALVIASKYEEIYPPKLEDFAVYTDGACVVEDVRSFEIIMLKELQWSLASLTSIHWLNMYMQFLGNKKAPESSGDTHVTDLPFIVPDTLREDFVNMAKVLDLLLLDVSTLKFSYREMAAAVLFACYEPHSLVQEVTGYLYSDLLKVVEWVEPVVKVCERLRSLGDPMPILEGIRADDLHNIQTHPDQDFGAVMAEIEKERESAKQAREKMKVPVNRRRGPLRARCINPDHITIVT